MPSKSINADTPLEAQSKEEEKREDPTSSLLQDAKDISNTGKEPLAKSNSKQGILFLVLVLFSGAALSAAVYFCNFLYTGSAVSGYFYLGQLASSHFKEGVFWPLYYSSINNGVLAQSLGVPLSSALFGLLSYIASSNLVSFAVFAGAYFVLVILVWFAIGQKKDKKILAAFFGCLFFLLPSNLELLFIMGDLPACLVLTLSPVLIYWANSYIENNSWPKLIAIFCTLVLSFLLDARCTFVVVLSLALYALVFGLTQGHFARFIIVCLLSVLCILASAIWLYPAILAGLNVSYLSNPGEFACIVSTLCSALLLYLLLSEPLVGKRTITFTCIALVALCIYPSYLLISELGNSQTESREAINQSAFEQGAQRILMLDGDDLKARTLSVDAAALGTSNIFDRISAPTQITSVESAFKAGQFAYVFDRSIELGCDVVFINVDSARNAGINTATLESCANKVGYELTQAVGSYAIYELSGVYQQFGSTTKYAGIAIGSNVLSLSEAYPAIYAASSSNLDDYVFEDLKDYSILYLDNFTYSNVDKATELLEKLAVSGCKVVINVASNQNAQSDFVFSESYQDKISFINVIHSSNRSIDESAMLGEITAELGISKDTLPQRSTVPLRVTEQGSSIRFSSSASRVNTSLIAGSVLGVGQSNTAISNYVIVGAGQSEFSFTYPFLNKAIEISVFALFGTFFFFVCLWAWARHLNKIQEIADMTRNALEVARVSTTSVATEIEPSDWSTEDWTHEQIHNYLDARPVFKRFTSYPSLDDLSKLSDQLGLEKWRQSSDIAQVLAVYLSCHPNVMAVRYPGLKTDPFFKEASSKLRSGFGPYVWFATAFGSRFVDCTQETDAKNLVIKVESYIAQNEG